MKLKASFFPWLILAFLLTNLVHECAHWLMGAALGFDMRFSLNGVGYLSPTLPWQRALADGAGPLVTVVQAILAYLLVKRGRALKAFAFLYAAAFMRLTAGLVSVLHPNDEARLGLYLSIGKWTLPILVAAGLVFLALRGARRLELGWKDHLALYLVASLSMTAIVFTDRLLVSAGQ